MNKIPFETNCEWNQKDRREAGDGGRPLIKYRMLQL